MVKYKDLKAKLLSDPEVIKEYDNMGFEYQVAQAIIERRVKTKMAKP